MINHCWNAVLLFKCHWNCKVYCVCISVPIFDAGCFDKRKSLHVTSCTPLMSARKPIVLFHLQKARLSAEKDIIGFTYRAVLTLKVKQNCHFTHPIPVRTALHIFVPYLITRLSILKNISNEPLLASYIYIDMGISHLSLWIVSILLPITSQEILISKATFFCQTKKTNRLMINKQLLCR